MWLEKALSLGDAPLSFSIISSESMLKRIDTNNPAVVERTAEKIFRHHYRDGDFESIRRTFADIQKLFKGELSGYQACDMRYHDLEHTLEATVAMMDVVDGMNRAPDGMFLPEDFFTLGMHAVLMHDAGYLKEHGDADGTGAKYTLTHVHRSAEFADRYLLDRGYSPHDRAAVQHMILCTGFFVDTCKIPFQSEPERMAGYALGTGDLLGQMAAPDYLEELEKLFDEFQECVQRQGPAAASLAAYSSVEDMRAKTPQFFRGHVMRTLTHQWGGVYRFMERPLGSGKNPYLEAIVRNIRKVDPRFRLRS